MPKPDDIELLKQYAEEHSETAFAALVERYLNLVYSTALRRAGSPPAAEEITQAVFILLAKKAKALGGKIVLSGWLYHTTQLTAANFLRGEIRRQRREQEAHMQSVLNEPPPADEAWRQIGPLLEDAMTRLGARDRDAIVLRFFENKNLREVGAAIGTSEDAAKVRVNRALEKLRKIFARRGVNSTTAIIAGAITVHSVQAAPAALVKTISTVAIAKGAAAGTSTLALVKGVLNIMAWTKAKTTVVVGVSVLLAAGTTTIAVKEIKQKVEAKAAVEDDSWRVPYFDSRALDHARPQVKILPAKGSSGGYGSNGGGCMGIGSTVDEIVLTAYQQSAFRTIFPPDMPAGSYDFIDKLPPGSAPQAAFAALQAEVKKKFGVVGHLETRDADVLILTAQNRPRPGLKPSAQQNPSSFNSSAGEIKSGNRPAGAVANYLDRPRPDSKPSAQQNPSSFSSSAGEIKLGNRPVGALANYLERVVHQPVIDRTGITGNYDMTLKWNETDWKNRDLNSLNRTLSEQFGLELVPGREPIEMLVVEKAN